MFVEKKISSFIRTTENTEDTELREEEVIFLLYPLPFTPLLELIANFTFYSVIAEIVLSNYGFIVDCTGKIRGE